MAIFFPGSVGIGSETQTERIGPGLLTAVSIFTDTDDADAADCWMSVAINRGGLEESNRIVSLCAGFVTRHNPLHWHGLLEVQDEDYIFYYLTGNLVPGFRCIPRIISTDINAPLRRYLSEILSSG